MLRDILDSRAIQMGLLFFVLVVGGSLLYRWHVHHTTERDMAKHDRFLQGTTETENRTRPTQSVDVPTDNGALDLVNTADEITDTPMPEAKTLDSPEPADFADAFLPEDFVVEEAPPEDLPVSPFGFGPYPEVPSGFPKEVAWHWSEEKRQEFADVGRLKDMELMDRVLIKLWNRGDRDWRGAKRDDFNGKVYPLYKNYMYVSNWTEVPVAGGKTMPFPVAGTSAGTDGWHAPDYLPIFYESGGQLPDHIQFTDYDTAGYDPYTFLNLKK